MSTVPAESETRASATASRARERLHNGALAMIIFLIAQYVFGMWSNLYATIPAADHHAGLGAAVGDAITNGPVELSIHAVLGILLTLMALSMPIRAAMARDWVFFSLSIVGLGCIIGAAANGAAFVSTSDDVHSLIMAMLWAASLLVFVAAMFITGRRRLSA